MPDAIITSTASTFGTISGTFTADQSTITGTVSGVITGTLSGSVGVPGPQGKQGIPGPIGPEGPPGEGGTWGSIVGTLSDQTDLQTALDGKYSTSNPSGFITSSALSPYLTTATANATFQTLSGMSSYLTTSAAAAGYYPLTGNPSGFLTSASLSGYATESWVTGQGYITSSALTPYLSKADNLASVASVSTARDNLGLGSLSNPTFAGVTVQGSGANVANLTPTSLSLTHATSGSFTIQPSVGITFPDASVQTTAYTGGGAAYISSVSSPLSVTSGNLSIDLSSYLTTSAAASTYYPLTNPDGYITSSALTGYATESFVTSQGYITSSALAGYATESWVTDGFYPIASNPAGYLTSASLSGYALLSGATFTGTLSAPTPSPGTDSTVVATTEWVKQLDYAPLNSPQFVGNPRGPTPSLSDDDTSLATTAFVKGQGYITSAALSPYLLSSTAASTYQTLSGMSSYLTTASAASTYATILEPSVDGILTIEPSGTNSAQVQVQQDANNYIRLLPGTDITFVSSNAIKWRFTPTELRFPDASTQSVAYPGSSGFLLKADNLSGLASTSTARTNLGLGTMAVETASNYLTTASAASTYFTIASASNKADLASPTFTGVPAAPTASPGTNTTQLATTAFVTAAVSASTGATWGSITGTLSSQTDLQSALDAKLSTSTAASTYQTLSGMSSYLTTSTAASTYQTIAGMSSYLTTASAASTYATLASPALTGNPTAPTPSTGDNDTSIATTAFVKAQGYLTSAPVTSVAGKTGAVTLVVADVSGAAPLASPTFTGTVTIPSGASISGYATTASLASYAPLASPALTGTPTAPTASAGTSTTQLATTAFVTTADNLKANLASPAFTGTPTAPTATAGTNTTQIATTAFVTAAIPTNNVKAWVNFNGTGTVAIRASMNVSSITDNGVGDYTVNFTTAISDADYAVGYSNVNNATWMQIKPASAANGVAAFTKTTSAVRFGVLGAAAGYFDSADISVIIIR